MSFFSQSVSQYRTLAFTYVNIERRLQYALQGFSQDHFFYGQNAASLRPVDRALHRPRSRAGRAEPARRHGVRDLSVQPVPRIELFSGYMHLSRELHELGAAVAGRPIPAEHVRIAALPERQHAPGGRDVRLGNDGVPRVRARVGQHVPSRLQRVAEFRHVVDLAADARRRRAVLRAPGGQRRLRGPGARPQELRQQPGLPVLRRQLRDARLRLPRSSSDSARGSETPSCASRSSRRSPPRLASWAVCAATFYADIGGAAINNVPFTFMSNSSLTYTPIIGYRPIDAIGNLEPIYGPPVTISGLRLWTAARRTASACRASCSAFRCTSTSRGRRCSTATGRTRSSRPTGQPRVPQDEVRVLDRLRLLSHWD